MKLELDEARRLTGANLLWEKPGAIVDVLIDGIEPQLVSQSWQKWMRQTLDDFSWQDQQMITREYEGGASFAISAPMDALYVACELVEFAWDCCVAELQSQSLPDRDAQLDELRNQLAEQAHPQLLELIAASDQQGVSCLVDDDELSFGLGPSAEVWPIADIPAVDSIDWAKYSDVPRAYVTGTNGKSTSVRLASEIANAAGKTAGITSTDYIRVGEDIIDRGDYSGPGGARILLRDNRCEIAFMEVARGGILRRGLPVSSVNAALVTNVASDHLGQYGVNTVEDLAATKFVVAKALDDRGVLVVNADNELVVEQAKRSGKTLCWYSQFEDNPLIQEQLEKGGRAVYPSAGQLRHHYQGKFDDFGLIEQMPMTFGGTAAHNIQNALGVVGLCKALYLPRSAIRTGLMSFGSNAEDNPGRGNVYQIRGCKVIVDFAHNQHSMRAVVDMVKRMPANNRIAMFSHGGDRSDQDIKGLTEAVAELDASYYITAELEAYLRGREMGEIPQLVSQILHDFGVDKAKIKTASDPLDGAKQAVEMAVEGDVVLLFVLDQREEVHEFLNGNS